MTFTRIGEWQQQWGHAFAGLLAVTEGVAVVTALLPSKCRYEAKPSALRTACSPRPIRNLPCSGPPYQSHRICYCDTHLPLYMRAPQNITLEQHHNMLPVDSKSDGALECRQVAHMTAERNRRSRWRTQLARKLGAATFHTSITKGHEATAFA